MYICTVMAGVILLVLGLTGAGTLIKYIPYPVTMGFTCGIAVLIMSTQIKDFLGLAVDKVPAEFFEKLKVLFENLNTMKWQALALSAVSLSVILFWPAKWARRIPASIVALILGTLAVGLFDLRVETIGTRFCGITQ